MSPHLWLPREAARGIIDEQAGVAEARRVFGHVERRLKAHDARTFLFLCDRDEQVEANLRKGFYYLGRHNEDGTTTLWEVRNPDGSYREPDEAVVQAFLKGDANRRENSKAGREAERAKERRRRERAAERAKEERLDRMFDLAAYKFRVQIPVTDGWKKAVER